MTEREAIAEMAGMLTELRARAWAADLNDADAAFVAKLMQQLDLVHRTVLDAFQERQRPLAAQAEEVMRQLLKDKQPSLDRARTLMSEVVALVKAAPAQQRAEPHEPQGYAREG